VSEKKQSNSSVAMIKIPGVLVMTFYCFIMKVVGSSRSAGLSNFLSVSVSSLHRNQLVMAYWFVL